MPSKGIVYLKKECLIIATNIFSHIFNVLYMESSSLCDYNTSYKFNSKHKYRTSLFIGKCGIYVYLFDLLKRFFTNNRTKIINKITKTISTILENESNAAEIFGQADPAC